MSSYWCHQTGAESAWIYQLSTEKSWLSM